MDSNMGSLLKVLRLNGKATDVDETELDSAQLVRALVVSATTATTTRGRAAATAAKPRGRTGARVLGLQHCAAAGRVEVPAVVKRVLLRRDHRRSVIR
jgi:hypothetical protein